MTHALYPTLALLALTSPLLLQEEACGDGDPGGAPTADDLLALTQSCDQLSGTTLFATDAGGAQTIPMCELNGAIWFRADMDIDCDGGTESACKADPYYQPETSATSSTGQPLDASHLPFTVMPLDSNGFTLSGSGLSLGSVTAVIYNGQVYYGPLGDRGPRGTLGEGSYAMAEQLGINPNPVSGGIASGVTYIYFTGTDAKVSPIESEAEAQILGAEQAADLLADN